MAVVAKWLTHRIVIPAFVGSIPISRPFIIGLWPSGKALDFDSSMRRFDPFQPSFLVSLAQLVEHLTFNQRVAGSNPAWLIFCGSSSVVEYDLAKVGVAGSNPVFRSNF